MDRFLPPQYVTVPSLPPNPTFAGTTRKQIEQSIADFQDGLAPDEEIGAKLAQFGQVVTIAIEGISHRHPYLIEFAGRTLEGDRCVLVQHMSQTNILLIAIKAPSGREPRRIGFQAEQPSDR